jgi:hypothetical protein
LRTLATGRVATGRGALALARWRSFVEFYAWVVIRRESLPWCRSRDTLDAVSA